MTLPSAWCLFRGMSCALALVSAGSPSRRAAQLALGPAAPAWSKFGGWPGLWQERCPSVGGAGRSLSPWLQLGTAGGFVNRLLPSTLGMAKPFICIQTRSLSDQQGAEVGLRSGALVQRRELRLRDFAPKGALV